MKQDFDETTFYAESTFGDVGRNRPDFAPTQFGNAPKPRKSKRLMRVFVGLLSLLCGYFALTATADSATGWLIARVSLGFSLLVVGGILAVGPLISALLGQRE